VGLLIYFKLKKINWILFLLPPAAHRALFSAGFIKAYRRAHMEPTKKYPCAVTESQEIGWFSAPLNPPAFHDPRLNFRRVTTHVTKYATFTQQASNTTK
uniref:Uncharacterized protein n=1 Tax=Kryptolebias marmoratus TaxID=37003 RepID=A0A3Q3AET9_KRYMA